MKMSQPRGLVFLVRRGDLLVWLDDLGEAGDVKGRGFP